MVSIYVIIHDLPQNGNSKFKNRKKIQKKKQPLILPLNKRLLSHLYALNLYSIRILSAIKATNSEFVGLPFPLLTV